MFKIDEFLVLRHNAGLGKRGWKGARVAQVVSPDEFPELREELLGELNNRGLSEEIIKEMVAVKWVDILTAVDGFYLADRFAPITTLTGTEFEDEEGNSHVRTQTTLN